MKYFVTERSFDEIDSATARAKARDDAESIVKELGYMPITLDVPDRSSYGKLRKIWWQFRIVPVWIKNLKVASKGDDLFIQFPFREHSIFLPLIFRKLNKRGVKTTLLVHDLELFRCLKDSRRSIYDKVKCFFETKTLKYASRIILHNDKMIQTAKEAGLSELRLVNLRIFDYLMEPIGENAPSRSLGKPVIIAGNLSKLKCGYLYELPSDVSFNLYGPRYEGQTNDRIRSFGAFPPEVLPSKLEGSFGLVWDGPSAKTCDGVFGKYLRINNPHKTSLYLASGIPVIIWKEAALADFILENDCGIAVSSLDEISSRLKMLTDEDYKRMSENTHKISSRLRDGYYLKNALKN